VERGNEAAEHLKRARGPRDDGKPPRIVSWIR